MRDISSRRTWTFTWNNYPDDWESQFERLQGKLAGYIVGEEIAPSTGTKHLQGWIDFGNGKKGRWSELKLDKTIHWEGARGNPEQNYKYCTKDGQYVAWGTGEQAKPKEEYTFHLEPSFWQRRLAKILEEEPDNRSVYWIWEPLGKAGKTSFQKWWVSNHKDTLVLSGKAADMKNGIVTWHNERGDLPRTVICNIPRSVEERFVSFTGLEEIKDMLFYSGKYEGGMINGKSPHLVIFANWEPETSQMSGDRWVIIRIPDGKGEGKPRKLDWTVEGPMDDFIA